MNQPLGNYIGNWLEVYESIKVLRGEEVSDLKEVTLNLSGAMIYLGGKAKSIKEGFEISEEMIKSGKAYNKLLEIVKHQKGEIFYIENPEKYPKTKYFESVFAEKTGYLEKVDNYQIGISALELGAGRKTKEDKIDPGAGIIFKPKIGDRVKKGEEIALIFTNNKDKIDEVKKSLIDAIEFTSKKVNPVKLIKSIIK
jgi:thymidine phosphorylase